MLLCAFVEHGASAHEIPSDRVLVLPFQWQAPGTQGELGLALALVLYDQSAGDHVLLPFAQLRDLARQEGVSLVQGVDLATGLEFGRRLQAAWVLTGFMEQGTLTCRMIDVNRLQMHSCSLPLGDEEVGLADLAHEVAVFAGLSVDERTRQVNEFYRVLAASYALSDDARRSLWQTLLEHHQPSPFLLEEYFAMHGDPLAGLNQVQDLAHWRDLLLKHGRPAAALKASSACLRLASDPASYGTHARILFMLGDEPGACRYLKMALVYGFDAPHVDEDCARCNIECLDWRGQASP